MRTSFTRRATGTAGVTLVAGEASLPPGWQRMVDPNGTAFFHNMVTGEVREVLRAFGSGP